MSSLISSTRLEALVSGMIKKSRFVHSQGVAMVAEKILSEYGYDPIPGLYTGLFHDAYRYIDPIEALTMVIASGMPIEEEERKDPILLHGAVAALRFPSLVGDCPTSWLKAMRWHTLGNVDMGIIGAALYIGDFAEPTRTHLTDDDRNDIFSEKSIEGATLNVLRRDRDYAVSINRESAKTTKELLSFLERGGTFA